MAFSLIIPGLFNKVLRLTRKKNIGLVNKVMVFSNKVSILSFPEKLIKSYKIIKVKVGKSFSANVVYISGAYGPFRLIKYSITDEILNLLLTVGITELYLRNVFLGK